MMNKDLQIFLIVLYWSYLRMIVKLQKKKLRLLGTISITTLSSSTQRIKAVAERDRTGKPLSDLLESIIQLKESSFQNDFQMSEEKKTPAAKRKSKSTKFKKAPQAPKRFKSAFMLFSTEKHPEIRAQLKEGDDTNVPNVAKLVAEAWRNLSPEDRAAWEKRSSDDKKRYEV